MHRNLLASILGAGSVATIVWAAPASGQVSDEYRISLPAQDLSRSLRAVSTQTGRSVVAPDALVKGRQAPAISGPFTAEAALRLLLTGSGLDVRRVGDAFVIFAPADPQGRIEGAETPAAPGAGDEQIVVTGTRIRGAPIASPVITLTSDEIRNQGDATLAEAVRTIPQNFGGGQNPGVGNNVPASSGVNVGSAASVNLRGLGSDATLTLLNGHRLSYSASRQAIDVSAIPLGAVDRIEIVPDGASALYGSDAVAGVVNIILKRDYEGVETRARIGSSTDGGGFDQLYGAVAGARWRSGGLIASFEYGRSDAILGADRSYARDRPVLTLYPFLRNYSAAVSGHQDLTPNIELDVDGLYNHRFSDSSYASNAAGNISLSGTRFAYTTQSFVIAPTLRLAPGGGWRVFLTGSYGEDRTRYDVTTYSRGVATPTNNNCYCNNEKSVELGGDGSLLHLPAGPVKLAAGIGYRSNRLTRFNGAGADTNVSASQDSYYGYGELSLPLISERQEIALVHKLLLTAAVRYEKYPAIGEVLTPKVGAIYAPSADFDLKGSWGKSFRAPTLQEQYGARLAILLPPFFIGGSSFPAGAEALVIDGGNPDLKPERATSWSATLDVHPRAVSGLRLELSYFNTRYRDRVVTPISSLGQALSNPIYANRLTLNPSAALLNEEIASAISLTNITGAPFDPSTVAVLVDNGNVNAARQSIQGGDLLLAYRTALGSGGDHLGLTLNATYLSSDQQLAANQPVVPLAGLLFNPPHVRARAGVSWDRGPVTATTDLSYIGGVYDRRRVPALRVGSLTTLDLTLRYRTPPASRPLGGLDVSFTVQNLFNAKPARIATTLFSDAPYDSTNYSPLGRFVAISLSKRW